MRSAVAIAAATLALTGLTIAPSHAAGGTSDLCGGSPADLVGAYQGTIEINSQPSTIQATFTAPNAVTTRIVYPSTNPVRDDTLYGNFSLLNDSSVGKITFDSPIAPLTSNVLVCGGASASGAALNSHQVSKIQGYQVDDHHVQFVLVRQ